MKQTTELKPERGDGGSVLIGGDGGSASIGPFDWIGGSDQITFEYDI